MTITARTSRSSDAQDADLLDIEALFPADPDLMSSPEGDERGLRQLRRAAAEQRAFLAESIGLTDPPAE